MTQREIDSKRDSIYTIRNAVMNRPAVFDELFDD